MGAWIETQQMQQPHLRRVVAPPVGAWIETLEKQKQDNKLDDVAPPVGAWIETECVAAETSASVSHPPWVRGLKLEELDLKVFWLYVAPPVGAWIETSSYEILWWATKSHPPWVRGLKLDLIVKLKLPFDRRTPRGCVD